MISKIFSYFYKKIKLLFLKIKYKGRMIVGSKISYREKLRINIAEHGNLKLGNEIFFNHDCSINVHNKVEIGSFCIFGENVKIYDHNHVFKNSMHSNIKEQGFKCGEIIIGDNCWIGSNVVILKDVHIGKNSVIGAGCVISSDIPEGSIVRLGCNYCIEKIEDRS